jgi:tRNA U55 pseudouridine synthase TruB
MESPELELSRKQNNNVVQIYKPIGLTPLESMKQYCFENNIDFENVNMSYSGRLDPMAHGSLLLLFNDEVKKSDMYNMKDKKYKFQMLIGITTDTTDILGIPSNNLDNNIDEILNNDKINEIIKKYNNYIYEQEYHIFSSFVLRTDKNKREPLWRLAKENRLPTKIPTKKVHIYELNLLKTYTINKNDLQSLIKNNLSSLTDNGNFRLDEIKSAWNSYPFKNEYLIMEFDTFVSSGTYIRQLVKDIGNDFNHILNKKIDVMVIDLYRYQFLSLNN